MFVLGNFTITSYKYLLYFSKSFNVGDRMRKPFIIILCATLPLIAEMRCWKIKNNDKRALCEAAFSNFKEKL